MVGRASLMALGLGCLAGEAHGAIAKLADADTCPGTIDMPGYGEGKVSIVATKWNVPDDPASKVEVIDGKLVPNLGGRSYFADACVPGEYKNTDYVAMKLLGKTLRFTTDLSALGCGCNAAFYLTNLNQNGIISSCQDFYCDANSVCGVRCPEIDIMEANKISFHATLHEADDGSGVGGGYGGGGDGWSGPRDWNQTEYGPGADCIDTTKPFEVAVSFPTWEDDDRTLAAYILTLSQASCKLNVSVAAYDGNTTIWPKGAGHGMQGVSQGLLDGMAPIASFWQSEDMLWMDGEGEDKKGPCKKDLEVPCPAKVEMWNFSLEDCPPMERGGTGGMPLWFYIVLVLVVIVVVGVIVAVLLGACKPKSDAPLMQGQQE